MYIIHEDDLCQQVIVKSLSQRSDLWTSCGSASIIFVHHCTSVLVLDHLMLDLIQSLKILQRINRNLVFREQKRLQNILNKILSKFKVVLFLKRSRSSWGNISAEQHLMTSWRPPVPPLPAEGHAVDHRVGLAELLPDLAVPLRQSGHLGEVVSPELNYPANTSTLHTGCPPKKRGIGVQS